MEGNRLIPSSAAFARDFVPVAEAVCPECMGAGVVAVGMDGDIIPSCELHRVPTDEIEQRTCRRCDGTGFITY